MKLLVIVQTSKELEWACAQAAKSNSSSEQWYILRIGDIQSGVVPPPPATGISSNCRMISVDELNIDSEQVWRDTRRLEPELWRDLKSTPRQQLHLTAQWLISILLFRLIYLEAVISEALEYVRPDEVRVPPHSSSRISDKPLAIVHFQWMVCAVAARHNIKFKRFWFSAIQHSLLGLPTSLKQVAFHGHLLLYDLTRIVIWLWAVARHASRSLLSLRTHQDGKEAEISPALGAIILANVDSDLGRQFDLKRLSSKLAKRCLVWIPRLNQVVPLTDNSLQEQVLPLYLSGRNAEADAVMRKSFAHTHQTARRVFPTLVTPLILGHRDIWYCSALPARIPAGTPPQLRRLIGSRGMAEERFLNWRRLVFAGKHFASACNFFKALRPALLVTGDAGDIHRAITLAARHCEVPSLATSHGLEIRSENFHDLFPLADVHCLFGNLSALIAETNLPGTTTQRIVCHDKSPQVRHTKPASIQAGGVEPRRRIFIVTGGIINHDLFIRGSVYSSSLYALVNHLSALEPRVEIIFKSHPLYDQYELYEEIRRAFPSVVSPQWREPLTDENPIPADVIVFYNYLSTLFFTAIQQGIPIVAHWGAFTPLGRRVVRGQELAGSDDSNRLGQLISELLASPDGAVAREVRSRMIEVCNKFIEPPKGGLEEAIRITIGQDSGEPYLPQFDERYPILTGQNR